MAGKPSNTRTQEEGLTKAKITGTIELKVIIPIANMDEDSDILNGSVEMYGIPHHLMFIRVKEDEKTGELVPTRDPNNQYEDLCRLYDQSFRTIKLPGLEGDWVAVMHPHGA